MAKQAAKDYSVVEVMELLKVLGNENTAKIYKNRDMHLEVYGVKIADLKKIVKQVKKNHELSLDLYDTNNYDAMYLAGLIADETKITKETLEKWVENSDTYLIAEYTVPWVASETTFGMELGLKWIESEEELTATAGWSVLTNIMRITEDEHLDLELLKKLLLRCENTIHSEKNRVRYSMNSFVIGVGSFVKPLLIEALASANVIGEVKVDMGKTACNVPNAHAYIEKVVEKGYHGKKSKTSRC